MTQTNLTLRNTRPSFGAKLRSADRFWPVLRDLVEARNVFGLGRPVLTTLRALISFLEEGSVVFASNRSLSMRAEGISESALRRHIKALVDVGLVIRRDSSNGKRYRIDAQGQDDLIFGLDLAPLDTAREQIAEAAERCRQENRMIRYLRKQLGQLIYHARTLGRSEAEILPYQNALRQKLSSQSYAELCETLTPATKALEKAPDLQPAAVVEDGFTSKMTGSGIQNDCHKYITEVRLLNPVEATELAAPPPDPADLEPQPEIQAEPALLRKAKALAPDALAFADRSPQSWQEVETLAWRLAAWSGISPKLLSAAIETAGQRMTAMAVLTVTQNSSRIRNPGAYFRTLTMGRHFPRFSRPLAHLS